MTMTNKEFARAVESENHRLCAEKRQLRNALSDMVAHMFGPDDTGKSRPEIEAQARAALKL